MQKGILKKMKIMEGVNIGICISAKSLLYFFKEQTGIKTLTIINTVRKTRNKGLTLETEYYISSLEPEPITIL